MGDSPPVETPTPPPKTPGWVKVFAIIAIVVVLIVVFALVFGGGKHGPGRHLPGGSDKRDHNPPAQYGP